MASALFRVLGLNVSRYRFCGKGMGMLGRVIFLVIGLFLVTSPAKALYLEGLDQDRYQIHYGDIQSVENGLDGYPDVLLRAKREYALITAGTKNCSLTELTV